jgi:hypothetical protein
MVSLPKAYLGSYPVMQADEEDLLWTDPCNNSQTQRS